MMLISEPPGQLLVHTRQAGILIVGINFTHLVFTRVLMLIVCLAG